MGCLGDEGTIASLQPALTANSGTDVLQLAEAALLDH